MKLLDTGEKLRHEDFQELLQKLLPGLALAAISFLEDSHELRLYQPGDVLLKEGQSGDGVLFLRYGAAAVSLVSKWGDSAKLCEIIAPAILGLSATMVGDANRTTVRCEHPIEAVFIPAPALIAGMRRFPQATLEFSKLISDELSATYSKLARMRQSIGGTREGRNVYSARSPSPFSSRGRAVHRQSTYDSK